MSPRSALATVAASAVVFALLGGIAGHAIGRLAPGFYVRSGAVQANAAGLGAALGIGQGLTGGALLGTALVAILAWRDVRRESLHATGSAVAAGDVPRPASRAVPWISAAIVASVVLCAVSGTIGALLGATNDRYEIVSVYLHLEPLVSDGRFPDVRVEISSGGPPYLVGTVASREELAALRSAVESHFEDEEARFLVGAVRVAE